MRGCAFCIFNEAHIVTFLLLDYRYVWLMLYILPSALLLDYRYVWLICTSFLLQVVVNENEASELESEYRILRPAEEGEFCRIKPNPSSQVQPRFIDPGPLRNVSRGLQTRFQNGLCLEITGRVQHVDDDKTAELSE